VSTFFPFSCFNCFFSCIFVSLPISKILFNFFHVTVGGGISTQRAPTNKPTEEFLHVKSHEGLPPLLEASESSIRPETPSKLLKKDSVVIIKDRQHSGPSTPTPAIVKQDSFIVNKRRISLSNSPGEGAEESPPSAPPTIPRSPMLRHDSITVYKERRASGTDNSDPRAKKLASVNAQRKMVRASLPPIGGSRSLFSGGVSESRTIRKSAPPQMNMAAYYDQQMGQFEMGSNADAAEHPNQNEKDTSSESVVATGDLECIDMQEAKRLSDIEYAKIPLSPDKENPSKVLSTRRGSLKTSHAPKQTEAQLAMLMQVDPSAAALKGTKRDSVDSASPSVDTTITSRSIDYSRSASVEIPCA
jgi:hypothetical protein